MFVVCESCQLPHENSKLECGEIKDSYCNETNTSQRLPDLSAGEDVEPRPLGTSCNEQMTSTPSRKVETELKDNTGYRLADGCYSSQILHKNGSSIGKLTCWFNVCIIVSKLLRHFSYWQYIELFTCFCML